MANGWVCVRVGDHRRHFINYNNICNCFGICLRANDILPAGTCVCLTERGTTVHTHWHKYEYTRARFFRCITHVSIRNIPPTPSNWFELYAKNMPEQQNHYIVWRNRTTWPWWLPEPLRYRIRILMSSTCIVPTKGCVAHENDCKSHVINARVGVCMCVGVLWCVCKGVCVCVCAHAVGAAERVVCKYMQHPKTPVSTLPKRYKHELEHMSHTWVRQITSTFDVVDAARVAAASATVQCYRSGARGVRAVCSRTRVNIIYIYYCQLCSSVENFSDTRLLRCSCRDAFTQSRRC